MDAGASRSKIVLVDPTFDTFTACEGSETAARAAVAGAGGFGAIAAALPCSTAGLAVGAGAAAAAGLGADGATPPAGLSDSDEPHAVMASTSIEASTASAAALKLVKTVLSVIREASSFTVCIPHLHSLVLRNPSPIALRMDGRLFSPVPSRVTLMFPMWLASVRHLMPIRPRHSGPQAPARAGMILPFTACSDLRSRDPGRPAHRVHPPPFRPRTSSMARIHVHSERHSCYIRRDLCIGDVIPFRFERAVKPSFPRRREPTPWPHIYGGITVTWYNTWGLSQSYSLRTWPGPASATPSWPAESG